MAAAAARTRAGKDVDVPSDTATRSCPGSPPPTADRPAHATSYGQILRSTAFTGGASVIEVSLGIVRTKAVATLLGASGVGLIGLYTAITGLVGTLATMGIGSSGVRQIAEATGSGDHERIARTVITVRRAALACGAAVALLLAAFSSPVSTLTFGDANHASSVALLAASVFFTAVGVGQTALLKGLRRIGDLARLSVLGSVAGTVVGVALLWTWHADAIVPLLIALPICSCVFSWWFTRNVRLMDVRLSWRGSTREARELLGLGMAFMASGLMATAVAYVTRMLIVRLLGLEAAGHYAAAFTLAGVHVGFVLGAMGTDFYPRLAAACHDNATMNRLVNEQSEIALLLAVPGIIATIVFAPLVVRVFYAPGFEPAVEVLQWQSLGILGRVISWPMGFIILAKGRRGPFLWTELIANVAHVCFVIVGIQVLGLAGTGVAFGALYLLHTVVVMFVTRRMTGFKWSYANTRSLRWVIPVVVGVFVVMRELGPPWNVVIAAAALLVVVASSVRGVIRRVPLHQLARLRRFNRFVP